MISGAGAATGAEATMASGSGAEAAAATATAGSPRAHSGEQKVITLPLRIFAAGARSGSTVFWQFGQIIAFLRECQHCGFAVRDDQVVDVRDHVVASLHHGRDL